MIRRFLGETELDRVADLLDASPTGQRGIAELREVFAHLSANPAMPVTNRLEFDITLARGLNYYTGCIYEVAVDTDAHPTIRMGSIAGGGRYADLTGIFGGRDLPGVGISFGAERIYDVLEELDAFPADTATDLEYLIVCLDEATLAHGFQLCARLRAGGLRTDLYPKSTKLQKMLKYADQRGAPRVIIIGSAEADSGAYSVKDMRSGEQVKLTEANLV